LVKLNAPYGWVGQMEMKCIFDIGKNITVLAKVIQVSDVAHGSLVTNGFKKKNIVFATLKNLQVNRFAGIYLLKKMMLSYR
jgi:hypothetical protein